MGEETSRYDAVAVALHWLIGAVLQEMVKRGDIRRDEVVIATKGGYITFDGAVPPDPPAPQRSPAPCCQKSTTRTPLARPPTSARQAP